MKFLLVLCLVGMASAYHKYVNMKSDEIDSEEHGVTPGRKTTSCKCGWANKAGGRVVGGEETGVNQFPFAALIQSRKGMGYSLCGGTIISEYHVLTAAHCTFGFSPSSVYVYVGEHDRRLNSETDATDVIRARNIINHEQYDDVSTKFDIAIIELESKIRFSNKVGPACMPPSRNAYNLVDKYVKVMGWGLTTNKGQTSHWLRHTNLRVIPLDICKQAFRNSIDIFNPSQLCTFSKGRDACQGDSGGPVMYVDPETNRYTVVGVVSFGADCASQVPGVNTEVQAYLDWIQRAMQRTNPAGKTCKKI